ncbi:MAG: protein kinase [Nannocystaceae bacterium]|nr:protein kinase [Nannocystaceae bacterium]
MRCLDDESALALVEQRLDPPQRAAWLAHTGRCDDCRALLATLVRAVTTNPAPAPAAGVRVGPYTLRECLGHGGMGEVWSARDARLGRDVAIKLLHGGRSDARLLREARILARLVHPNIVAVHDVGRAPAGVWIAMERVDGMTLAAWARAQPRSAHEILAIYRQAALALAHAHAVGVVHRDFKPHNAMLGRDGRVRVLDFGLAAASEEREAITPSENSPAEDAPGERRRTLVGGTPGYMAPEQLRGHAASPASDQFAFCVVLWEALTGAKPFVGASASAVAHAVLHERPTRQAPMPAAIERALRRGLDRDPARRHADMHALLRALRLRPRWQPWAVVGATLAATTAAWVWPGAPACVRGSHRFDAAVQRLRGTDDTAALADHIDAWRSAAVRACEGAPDGMPDACLDERAAEITVALERLDEGAPARTAAAALQPLARCEARDADAAALAPPDPALAREVATLHLQLVTLGARAASDLARDHGAAFEALIAQADALGWAPLQVEVLGTAARHFSLRDDWQRAEAAFERAFHLARKVGDAASEFDAALGMVTVGEHTERAAEALSWIRHAEAALAHSPDPRRAAELLKLHGEVLQTLGRLDEAEAMLRRAVAVLPADADAEERATTKAMLGNLLASQWRFAEARPLYEEALREELLPRPRAQALNGLGAVLVQSGDLEGGARIFEQAVAFADQLELSSDMRWSPWVNLAVTYGELGQTQRAIAMLREAFAVTQRAGGPIVEDHDIEFNLALLHMRERQFDLALQWAHRILDDPEASPTLQVRTLWIAKQSRVGLGDPATALRLWQRRIELDLALQDLEELPDDLLELLALARGASLSPP